jgi:hypothetical protein
MSASRSNAFARASSLGSSTGEWGAAFAAVDCSDTTVTFGSNGPAGSRAVDRSAGGKSAADGRSGFETAAWTDVCSGDRPFPSVILEEGSAIGLCRLTATASHEAAARDEFEAANCRLAVSS